MVRGPLDHCCMIALIDSTDRYLMITGQQRAGWDLLQSTDPLPSALLSQQIRCSKSE